MRDQLYLRVWSGDKTQCIHTTKYCKIWLLVTKCMFFCRELPDDPNKHWSASHIMTQIKKYVQKADIGRVSIHKL